MNWITNIVRPRIKKLMGGKGSGGGDTPENLWKKCPSCGEMIFHRDLAANLHVCPNCGHHMRIGPAERFAYTFDPHQLHRTAAGHGSRRSAALQGREEICRRDEGGRGQDRRGRKPSPPRAARMDGLPVMIGGAAVRFPGRLAGHGGGRGLGRSRARPRSRKSGPSSCLSLRAARACRKACCR